jgi:hypothetical protein
MNLATRLTALNQDQDLPLSERATLACRVAKQFERAGEYEVARDALSEFWSEREKAPRVDDLENPAKAEVLLRSALWSAGWAVPIKPKAARNRPRIC